MNTFRIRLLPILCLLLTFCFVVHAQQAALSYQAPITVPTGTSQPNYVAVADFNGDGKPDLAVPDYMGKTVSVYLNSGDGTFNSPPIVTTLDIDNTLGAILAGDVDGDGKADLVVGTVAGAQFAIVLLGDGTGHFKRLPALSGSNGFESGQIEDLNADGHQDLVLGGNGSVYLFLGTGEGNFNQAPIPNGSFPGLYTSTVVGTFKRNGHLDALFADASDPGYQSGSIDYFPGTGTGSFGSPSFYTSDVIANPESLSVADFNKDGNLDLLVGSAQGAYLAVGNGDGTFQLGDSQLVQLYFSSANVASADLNMDGQPDAAVIDTGSGLLSLILNDGTGKFPNAFGTPYTYQLSPASYVLMTADFNGDGVPDILTSTPTAHTVTLLLSKAASAPTSISLTSSGNDLLVGTDLTITSQVTGGSGVATGSVSLLDGQATIATQALSSTGSATFSIASLAVGTHTLSTMYAGDPTHTAATSSALSQVVTDFQVALPSSTQTVTEGASAIYALQLTPTAGFNGTISVSCSGLPAYATCSVPQTTVASSPVSISVTVPTAPTALALSQQKNTLYAGVFFGGLFALVRRRRPLAARLLLLFVPATLLATGLTGCGHSSSTPPPANQTINFTINVTATQGSVSVAHTVTATLVVNS